MVSHAHSILGSHVSGSDLTFRVLPPGARKVSVLVGGKTVSTPREGLEGIFEGVVKDAKPAPYELLLEFENGSGREKDPYAFMPTLGPADLFAW